MANKGMCFGKATELMITSMLLEESRIVYLPVVDDHGVDILVETRKRTANSCYDTDNETRLETNSEHNIFPNSNQSNQNDYQELQVKAISNNNLLTRVSCTNPRANYWFVIFHKFLNTIWLINSLDFVRIASQNKKGANAGCYSISLATKKGPKHKAYIITNFSKLP